jgi:hypothetical protein
MRLIQFFLAVLRLPPLIFGDPRKKVATETAPLILYFRYIRQVRGQTLSGPHL